jgi:hypothetical protein
VNPSPAAPGDAGDPAALATDVGATALDWLHLQGYAAKVLSGASVRDEAIRRAFGDADERLAAWIVAGTAARRALPRPPAAERPQPLLSDWA